MSEIDFEEKVHQLARLKLARIERMTETGASTTIRITGILKFSADRSEVKLLVWLKAHLGNEYSSCLPDFLELEEVDGSFVIELEYVGDLTFEDIMVGRVRDEGLDAMSILERVSRIITAFSRQVSSSAAARFEVLREIVEAVGRNAQKAAMPWTLDLATHLDRATFTPCVCHRDLSVANVMCSSGGGVRFIDPRLVVPGADERAPSFGSAAIDAAALLVSLERKELERDRLGRAALGLVERFKQTAKTLMTAGAFNQYMLDLCLLHAYSIYAACACEYCLAPERAWLYGIMKERFEQASRRIA